jgi:protein TonB
MERVDISLLQKNRSIFLKLGFVWALGSAILALNWTTDADQHSGYEVLATETDIDDIPILRTPNEPKRALPPPSVKPSDRIVEEIPEFTETPVPAIPVSIDLPFNFDEEEPLATSAPLPDSPPPPRRPFIAEECEFIVVEDMPFFGDCEATTKEERKQCSDQKLLAYLYQNITYPAMARENGIENTVIVQFVIDKSGAVENAKVLRGGEGGLGREALRVVNSMPAWQPGHQRGRKVKVRMTLPIRFSLE